jgi:hypothetical protein
MANAPLRGCPTCGTPVEQAVGLGLRDYRWLTPYLPGRVAPSDLDSVLERNGRFLFMEYKPAGASLPMGQRIMLKNLVRGPKSIDVWVVWGDEKKVEVGPMHWNGEIPFVDKMSTDKLAANAVKWLEWATKEDKA